MKTYYELLSVAPGVSADEIKSAFRREIARYHPDKVQHLGTEFQEIAAVRASELTEGMVLAVSVNTLECPTGPLAGRHQAVSTSVVQVGADGATRILSTHNTLVTA